MVCNGCAAKLRQALTPIEGITVNSIDPRSGKLELTSNGNSADNLIEQAITKAGYKIITEQ
jgi:copper chaperone CopZ